MYYSTAKEMERLDELAVESGLEIRQMMELAGWHMVQLFALQNIPTNTKIVILCGTGNKGGDGLAATRHLVNHDFTNVTIVRASTELKEDSQHHLNLLEKMGIPITAADDATAGRTHIKEAEVVVDSLIGYHLEGTPRDLFADYIREANQASAKVFAYDIPSGIDATTGECFDPCVSAEVTLTLALPKKVFEVESARERVGEVYLADIGIPAFLYDAIAKNSRPDFGPNGIVKI